MSGGKLDAKRQLELTIWAELAYLAGITLDQAKAKLGSEMTDDEYEFLKSIWFANWKAYPADGTGAGTTSAPTTWQVTV